MTKNSLWSRREILRGVGVISLGTLGIFSAYDLNGNMISTDSTTVRGTRIK